MILSKLIVKLTASTEEFSRGLKKSSEETAAWKRAINETATVVKSDWRGAMGQMAAANEGLAEAMGGIQEAVGGLRETAGGTINAMRFAGKATLQFGERVVQSTVVALANTKAIRGMADGVRALGRRASDAGHKVGRGIQRVSDRMRSLGERANESRQKVDKWAASLVGSAIAALRGKKAVQTLESGIGKAGRAFASAGRAVGEWSLSLGEAAIDVATNNLLALALRNGWEALRNGAKRLSSGVQSLREKFGRFTETAKRLGGPILKGLSRTVKGVGMALSGLWKAGLHAARGLAGIGRAALHALGGVGRFAKALSDRVSPQLKLIAKRTTLAAAVLSVTLVGALGVAGKAITDFTIQAATIEPVQAAYEGFVTSIGESSEEMLARLRESSNGMVAQRDLMLSYNKAAQMVGGEFASSLPDVMGQLGKVAAATGQDIGFLLDSYVTGVARLSGPILDNLGIQVSLSEATERAAEMFGLQADQLSKTQLQMGMAAVVANKLAESTAAIPDSSTMAVTRLAQLKAAAQDAKDAIGSAFLGALGNSASALISLAQTGLPPLINALSEGVAPALETATGFLSDFLMLISDGMSPIDALRGAVGMTFGPEMAAHVVEMVGQVQAFIATVEEAAAPITQWIGTHVQLKDALIGVGIIIASVAIPAIVSLVASAAPIIAAVAAMIAIVAAMRTAWQSDFGGIQEKTAAVLAWLKSATQEGLAAIKEFWDEHGEQIVAIFQFMVSNVEEIFAAFKAAFSGDWEAFGEHLRVLWDRSWALITGAVQAAIDWIKGVDWGAVGKAIIDGIVNGVKAAAGWLSQALKDAVQAALDTAKGFLTSQSVSSSSVAYPPTQMGGMALGAESTVPSAALDWSAIASVRPAPSAISGQGTPTIVIYGGLTLNGVQDVEGLLSQLQALAV